MKFNSIKNRIYNSFTYRYNKLLARSSKLNGILKKLNNDIKLNNIKFTIPIIDTLGAANVHLTEDWFFKLIRSLKLPADSDFLDIGVNVGQSLLTFRSCYNNTYWGFEPNPACNFYLDHLVKINNLKNINILPVGLSSQNAVVQLYARNDDDSAATLLTELKPGIFNPQDAKFVPVFSFESLQLNINKIGFIKIDVEGAELDVISGMLETIKKHQPIITCEILDYTSPQSRDMEQRRATMLFNCLKEINYKVYRILHKNNTVLKFEEINNLVLKKWTPESRDLNDYLFLPEHITSLPE